MTAAATIKGAPILDCGWLHAKGASAFDIADPMLDARILASCAHFGVRRLDAAFLTFASC
jgi:hypothetical protein